MLAALSHVWFRETRSCEGHPPSNRQYFVHKATEILSNDI